MGQVIYADFTKNKSQQGVTKSVVGEQNHAYQSKWMLVPLSGQEAMKRFRNNPYDYVKFRIYQTEKSWGLQFSHGWGASDVYRNRPYSMSSSSPIYNKNPVVLWKRVFNTLSSYHIDLPDDMRALKEMIM